MQEREIQRKFIVFLRSHDILALKVESTSTTGLPDLLCIGRGGTFMIEVKQPGGRLSPAQKMLHTKLNHHGMKVFVCDCVEDLNAVLAEMKSPGTARPVPGLVKTPPIAPISVPNESNR